MNESLRHPFLDWTPDQCFEDGYDDGAVGKMLNPFGNSQGKLVYGATREQWVAWKRGNLAGHLDREDVKDHVRSVAGGEA